MIASVLIEFLFSPIDKALTLSEKEKQALDSSDFVDLKTAVDTLSKMRNESRELKSLKKELVDYEEDLKDLDLIKVSSLLL